VPFERAAKCGSKEHDGEPYSADLSYGTLITTDALDKPQADKVEGCDDDGAGGESRSSDVAASMPAIPGEIVCHSSNVAGNSGNWMMVDYGA